MTNHLRDIAALAAVLLAALALGSVYRVGSQGPQVRALQAACEQAIRDEHARFQDAKRLLQNLGAAVEPTLSDEQLANPAIAEAIEQAKDRLKEWGNGR